jgi:hypothetical protein
MQWRTGEANVIKAGKMRRNEILHSLDRETFVHVRFPDFAGKIKGFP